MWVCAIDDLERAAVAAIGADTLARQPLCVFGR
jgi:hypothetical protein